MFLSVKAVIVIELFGRKAEVYQLKHLIGRCLQIHLAVIVS